MNFSDIWTGGGVSQRHRNRPRVQRSFRQSRNAKEVTREETTNCAELTSADLTVSATLSLIVRLLAVRVSDMGWKDILHSRKQLAPCFPPLPIPKISPITSTVDVRAPPSPPQRYSFSRYPQPLILFSAGVGVHFVIALEFFSSPFLYSLQKHAIFTRETQTLIMWLTTLSGLYSGRPIVRQISSTSVVQEEKRIWHGENRNGPFARPRQGLWVQVLNMLEIVLKLLQYRDSWSGFQKDGGENTNKSKECIAF